MEVNKKARNELWNEINGIAEENLSKNTSNDRWSIKQILEHLFLVETAFTRMIGKQLKSGELVYADDQPIELTLNRSYKVQAPETLLPSEEDNSLEELKEKLTSSHEALLKLVKRAEQIDLDGKSIPHPAFGKLSLRQTIEFIGYHELRHIDQIREVKEELGLLEKN
ncbi:DUF664 domain-containing protein [Ornithinibacillus sp. L9]|uniref:DUF664 domain-containing protein n=1 Tax=Ornithinibacillus caprae TaxID=2678566 RepID=A0A6N8FH99_9BACI|nr:DinB family protein [Ornithinibacillus caprae]MUK88815.1 DUF664 domain-containing protein [Ornithinibacillus caprae]